MIVFELTMPNRGSWNGRWSQDNDRHIIVKDDRYFAKDTIQKILDKNETGTSKSKIRRKIQI